MPHVVLAASMSRSFLYSHRNSVLKKISYMYLGPALKAYYPNGQHEKYVVASQSFRTAAAVHTAHTARAAKARLAYGTRYEPIKK